MNDTAKFEISIGNRVLKSELISDGDIEVISANVYESFGKINKEYFDSYATPSILWGIDGDWLVRCIEANKKFYPTDHCGYIRVLSDEINPKYLAFALQNEGEKARFSRTNRASTDRVSNLEITLPKIDEQNKIISLIDSYENEIYKLENKISILNKDKEKIVKDILEII